MRKYRCRVCGEEDESLFYTYCKSRCKKCVCADIKRRTTQPNSRHKKINKNVELRKRALIRSYKDRPCMDCGIQFPFSAMQFDHVRGKKEFGIATMAARHCSDKLILEEISKCQICCLICHRIRTTSRNRDKKEAELTTCTTKKQELVRRATIRNRQFLKDIRDITPCSICLKNFKSIALDFHHIKRSDKNHNVTTMAARKAILSELQGTIILCGNCHVSYENHQAELTNDAILAGKERLKLAIDTCLPNLLILEKQELTEWVDNMTTSRHKTIRKKITDSGLDPTTKEMCYRCDKMQPLEMFYFRNGKIERPCLECKIKATHKYRAKKKLQKSIAASQLIA